MTTMDHYWLGKILWPDGLEIANSNASGAWRNDLGILADICLDILRLPIPTWSDPGVVSGEIEAT